VLAGGFLCAEIIFPQWYTISMHLTLAGLTTVGSIDLVVAVMTILMGIISIVLIVRVNRGLGGQIKSAIQFFVIGIDLNIVAIFWAVLVNKSAIIAGQSIDIQNLIIMVSMLFFILSARRFSTLVARV